MKRPEKKRVQRKPVRAAKDKGIPDKDESSRGQASPILIASPHAILDEAVSDAARTVAAAASGTEVSREQLSAAQDILNRKGITSGGQRSNSIPEDFARGAFAYVFRILGFGEIKWPSAFEARPPESRGADEDAFAEALRDA